jgi:lipopolysaccharide export LptBFGC system permease protein LptF
MIIYQQQRVAEPLNILAFYLLVIGVALRLLRFSLPANVNLTSLVLDRLWIFSLFGFFSVLVTALTIMIIYQQQRVAEPLNILAFYLLVIGVALRLLRFLRKQV